MVQKRSFVDELYEISSKHPRHLQCSSQLVSFLEFPSEDVAHKPRTSGGGEGGFMKSINDCYEKFGSDNITELPVCTEKDIENSLPCCISNSSWASSSISEEDVRSEAPFHILFSPEYYNSNIPRRTLVHCEDPPQKRVSIGPEFQANVPEWCAHGASSTSNCSDSAETSTISPRASEPNTNGDMHSGTCVIPMPALEPSAFNLDKVGGGRTDCCCEDVGSVRCVRQHIMEARESLRRAIGQERFAELGFYDMGEVVAETWSEEDEQLFHQIVFSNPSSSGKNFWDHLSVVFPFRTKKEIVSYYFNVFMLRRRAEQNRCDPTNIDSDDDEWEGSDDEVGMSEEDDDDDDEDGDDDDDDDDSGVESPVYQDDPRKNEIHEDDSRVYDEGIVHAASDYHVDVDFGGPTKILNCNSYDAMFQPSEKILSYGSCTSSDIVGPPQVSQMKVENGSKHWTGTCNGTSGGGDHGFLMEPTYAKEWDVGYLTRRNEADFLPTCSMIEEVFGVGSWNCNARDGNGLS